MKAKPEEYEDLAQELRIVILKASKKFDPNRGILFHTYLYAAMQNKIGTIYSKEQRAVPESELFDIFSYSIDLTDEVLLDLKYKNLSSSEMLVVDLFLCGFRKSDIRKLGVSTKNLDYIIKGLKAKFAH